MVHTVNRSYSIAWNIG